MRAIERGLCIAGGLVIAAGAAVETLAGFGHIDPDGSAVAALSLSYEQNLPTWYSTIVLFTASALLGLIARQATLTRADWRTHWWGLAALVLYMSLDENIEIHEFFGDAFELDGALYFGWVIPGAVLVATVGTLYISFLRSLPDGSRRRFIVAASVYLTGALVMELPLGYWTSVAGDDNVVYATIDIVEEALEIVGASLLVVALLEHLRTIGVRLDGAGAEPPR